VWTLAAVDHFDDERCSLQLALDSAESSVSQLQATIKEGTKTVTSCCMAVSQLRCNSRHYEFDIFIANKNHLLYSFTPGLKQGKDP